MSANEKQPLGIETLCSGCKWGKIMIVKNMVEENEDGDLFLADQFVVKSMCHNPLFVGDGNSENMGTVSVCEGFVARKDFKPEPIKITKKKRAKKPRAKKT